MTFSSGSFAHNNGTIVFKRASSTTTTVSGTSNASTTFTLYKAEFAAASQNSQFNIRNMTMQVENELQMSGTYQLFLNTNTSTTVECKGNIISTNTNTTGGGTVLLLVNGTGSQSITANISADAGKFPNITINKSSGTLSLTGTISLGGSTTWKYTAGSVSEGTARIVCSYNNTLHNNSSGAMTFNKMEYYGRGDNHAITGKIKITDTVSTQLTGDCIINGDTLEAQGKIIWNNTSSSSTCNAVMKITGSNTQTISGSAIVPLYDLVISKSSGDITLQQEVRISHSAKFNSGYIVSDATNLFTVKHGATVSGVSNSSFVKGPVKKIGNSAFVFPVGKGTNYQPLEITAPSNTTDVFTTEYFNSNQSHGTSKDSLTYLSNCEYWNLARTNGSSNVKVTLHWNSNSCDIYTLTTLRIARWDGSKWNNLGPVTTTGNTTTGTIQTNSNQSSFGDFIISKRSPTLYANSGNNLSICQGNNTTLGGSPSATGGVQPYTYSWTPSTSLNSTTIANPVASPTATISYILTVADIDLSVAKDTIIVTVVNHSLPIANAGPDYTVCNGIGVILGESPPASYGTPPYEFEWRNSALAIVSTEENPSVTNLSSFYILTVTDANSCWGKDSVEITLTGDLQAHAGSDTTVCFGSQVTLGMEATATGGEEPYTYIWYPSYYLNSFGIANPVTSCEFSESYILTITDAEGCEDSDTINVAVFERPSFYMNGANYVCDGGDTVVLGDDPLIEGGFEPYSYYWTPNYFISDTAIQNPFAYPPGDTVYYLVVTDDTGCVYYVPDSVIISHPLANAGFDQTIMIGCSVTLGGGPTAYEGVAPFTYLWNSDLVMDSTSANPKVQPEENTYYTLEITDDIGCLGYDTVIISVTPHADSAHLAIELSDLDTLLNYYKLITKDSIIWFKFYCDTNSAMVICGWVPEYKEYGFTYLTLYTDSADAGRTLENCYVGNVTPRKYKGIVEDELDVNHYYYLRIRKPGVTQQGVYLVYSNNLPSPEVAEELEGY